VRMPTPEEVELALVDGEEKPILYEEDWMAE
jgi:hypothetical protein